MEENNMIDLNSKNLLEKIYNSCNATIYTLRYIMSKSVNDHFKYQLEKNCNSVLKILNECLTLASKYNETLCDINFIKKTKIKATIGFNRIIDDSTENLTKYILTFFNCEIFSNIKSIDIYQNALEEVKEIAKNYNRVLEKNIQDTKKFLFKDPASFDEFMKKTKREEKKKKRKNNIKQKNNHE